jgi:hypothetical protein
MAVPFLTPIDLNNNEVRNFLGHLLASDPASPVDGQIWINTTTWVLKIRLNGVTISLGRLDQISAPTADVSLNSHKITGLATPTAATDAASKGYVDGVAAGLSWKQAVRAATTANGALATAFENGDVIDGVTLATGDRILIKNQTAPAENGIYTVNASGAPTRATDADTAAEILQAAVFVEEGTTNADTGWVLATNAPITLGTTGLTFSQFTGGSAITAGAGLTLTGNTIDAVAASGSGIVVNADNIDLDPTNGVPVNRGGTGAITAAGARTNLGATGKFSQSVGNGSLTSFTINHALGTSDVVVMVKRVSDGVEVFADVTVTDANSISVAFATAPSTNQYRVTVIG